MLTAEDKGHPIGADRSSLVAVPIGRWFTMDFYLKEGDADTGRFNLAITPEGGNRQLVYDHRGFTRNSTDPAPDGLSDYNAMKLYTSGEVVNYMKDHGHPLEVYWDDLRNFGRINVLSDDRHRRTHHVCHNRHHCYGAPTVRDGDVVT